MNSGIQASSGGVARYYLSEARRNAPVSTEITGYALSALLYLDSLAPAASYREAANRAAGFLVHEAWNERSATFPFELASNGAPSYAYFFDCGIIARGLMAAWRATGEHEYFDRAKECGLSMAFDFMAEEAMHPVLRLPDKQPLAPEARWSKRSGCYQLKSALAWRELADETGHRELSSAFLRMVNYALATHETFLPGETDPARVMDRLHAYGYFLEALLFVTGRAEATAAIESGIERMAGLLARIEPEFVRCDVYAQLLRVRLFADRLGYCPLDRQTAEREASRVLEFQAGGPDPRVAGGFYFGRKQGNWLPFINPVTTAFAIQALAMWREYDDGGVRTPLLALI
ncbi:MAG: hypothetical protein JSU00_27670 [Acidobacteria bacterium]|nr:hypothetical protein [Acidobacteriota bacterium]